MEIVLMSSLVGSCSHHDHDFIFFHHFILLEQRDAVGGERPTDSISWVEGCLCYTAPSYPFLCRS